jgi:restriction system protein
MAIPDFQTIMRPVLEMVADDQEHTAREIRERMANHFSLSPEELEELLPSGRAKLFANRVGWAITYLYQTKLLERPRRSVYHITQRGQEVLAQNPGRVDLRVLAQFEELHEFRSKAPISGSESTGGTVEPDTRNIRRRNRSRPRTGCCEVRSPPKPWSV